MAGGDAICAPPKLGQGASERVNLMVLRRTLNENYGQLALAGLATVGAVVVLVYLFSLGVEVTTNYYRFMVSRQDADVRAPKDDQVYPDATPGGDDVGPNREFGAIRSRIASLKGMYREYNKEMGSYARNILDRKPDDLIDERILAREHDDYKY